MRKLKSMSRAIHSYRTKQINCQSRSESVKNHAHISKYKKQKGQTRFVVLRQTKDIKANRKRFKEELE